MKKKVLLISFLFFVSPNVFSKSNFTDKCIYPEKPEFSEERPSSRDEMIVIQKKVSAYMEEGGDYLECLAELKKNQDKEMTDEQKKQFDKEIELMTSEIIKDMQSTSGYLNSLL